MNTETWTTVLQALFRELVDGSPDPRANTSMLNRGDPGLLASLDGISAAAASATSGGGASIAAHVDHLRYGLSLLNRRAAGHALRAEEIDFTASWRRNAVSESEWVELRAALRREAQAWQVQLGTPQELSETEALWFVGTVPHLAYHMGAIRQIDRATRGPTAEDEARVEAELRRAVPRPGGAMARAWEMRLDGRWWTRALLGFGLSGLVLNSLLSWFVYATLSTDPYATLPGWRRLLAWGADAAQTGRWGGALAQLARHPFETLDASFTLAAAIGILYATLRQRFDPAPEVGTTVFRAHRIALLVVSFVLPFLPLVAIGGILLRILSAPSP